MKTLLLWAIMLLMQQVIRHQKAAVSASSKTSQHRRFQALILARPGCAGDKPLSLLGEGDPHDGPGDARGEHP